MTNFLKAALIALTLILLSVAANAAPGSLLFHSLKGREFEVSFNAELRTEQNDVTVFKEMTEERRKRFTEQYVLPVTDYLFGPLVHDWVASPQRATSVTVDWDNARLVDGKVNLPYRYSGVWIIHAPATQSGFMSVPVPLSTDLVFSDKWKSCTDSDPEHQTVGFYWYFWDPKRTGCDHQEGVHYQVVKVQIGKETPNLQTSYPEYKRIIEDGVVSMTLAFGYVKDNDNPKPETDPDYGVSQYRQFVSMFKRQWGSTLKESDILLSEYPPFPVSNLKIGSRFTGEINGVKIIVNILVAASIDQMEIFAKSFAHDHDDVFAWFGHSRVGSGFDAATLEYMLKREPHYYKISNKYQMVYWAGCNSYSYYTLPFFKIKARASAGADPNGTLNLDIIANGLPSYFSLNAQNAMITSYVFLNWQKRYSYQTIIQAIEDRADQMGIHVLAAVLGDEDNSQ